MTDFIRRAIIAPNNSIDAASLYQALPIDRTYLRGMYNLIKHADVLLNGQGLRILL